MINENDIYVVVAGNSCVATCKLLDANKHSIGSCQIDISGSIWNISKWSTASDYQSKGYGKYALRKLVTYCLGRYGQPDAIQYTWNGQNSYVLDWMVSHFDAVCNCPLAVQKYNSDDDWSSHIYTFNIEKFWRYCDVG